MAELVIKHSWLIVGAVVVGLVIVVYLVLFCPTECR